MRRLSILALGLVLALLVAAPAQARDRHFQTPSKNIACLYHATRHAAWIRCDVFSLNDVAYVLRRRGPGKRIHVTDTVGEPGAAVLAYGHKLRLGRYTCRSRRTGLTCRNRRNGHGFHVSRASQRGF